MFCGITTFAGLDQVTTENVACGTSGVTCSKMIEVTVGVAATPTFYKLQLVRGQAVKPDPGSPFSVREVGGFVYIDTPFGLSIQWDKGTRVYVRLETQHIGKVRHKGCSFRFRAHEFHMVWFPLYMCNVKIM